MVNGIITANEVINHQPGNRENNKAGIKPGSNNKSLINDIFSCKIKTDPGKNRGYTIA
jgi:hypothetical protein